MILWKFTNYLLISINVVEKKKIGSSKCRNIKKSENKIFKVLAKLKSWNLPKSKSRNFSRSNNSNKIQDIDIIKKLNFPISSIELVFIKLR